MQLKISGAMTAAMEAGATVPSVGAARKRPSQKRDVIFSKRCSTTRWQREEGEALTKSFRMNPKADE